MSLGDLELGLAVGASVSRTDLLCRSCEQGRKSTSNSLRDDGLAMQFFDL